MGAGKNKTVDKLSTIESTWVCYNIYIKVCGVFHAFTDVIMGDMRK